MVIFSSVIMVPVLEAPSACACEPPRVWFKVTPFSNSSDGNRAMNGGGWIITVSESSVYGAKLECLFVKVSTTGGRIVIRTPRIGSWATAGHQENLESTWFSMRTGMNASASGRVMSRSTENRMADTEKDLTTLEHTMIVFIDRDSNGQVDSGDSIIIFRDPDADGVVELEGGYHLQLFKHINKDSKHSSVDKEIGTANLNWP
jgi:hypothetical protein